MYKKYYKRVIDFIISLILIILLSPLLILAIIVLSISNQGKPFYFQQRPGKNCKIFTIMKLKTMNDKKDYELNLLPDEERLTKVGAFIRKTSLDEIPQLINVLKGDMSLVGPRPLLMRYLKLYSPLQARRHEVKPGITGWAQVNGRNAISWEEKFRLDVDYVDNQSFWLDFRILWMTFLKVINRKDISAEGHATIEEFRGS